MGGKGGIKVASIYIGTVIGAGFASGQEIIQFFTKYGIKGFYGILVSSLLFGIIGSVVLARVYQHKIQSYDDFIRPIFGSSLGKIIKAMISLLLLAGYCVMLAGSGALFKEQLGLSKEVGILAMSMVTFLTFVFSVGGLAFINTLIVPLLLVGILVTGSMVMMQSGGILSNAVGASFDQMTGNWFTASLLYVSYNSISAVVVMASLYPLLKSKGAAVRGGMAGGLGLGLIAIFLLIPTLVLYTDIQGVEIPMLAIAGKLGKEIQVMYSILLWFAMLTTAAANGFVFIQSVESAVGMNHILTCFLFCIATIPLAGFGFKNLVNILYPIFGYVGIFMVLIMFIRNIYYKIE